MFVKALKRILSCIMTAAMLVGVVQLGGMPKEVLANVGADGTVRINFGAAAITEGGVTWSQYGGYVSSVNGSINTYDEWTSGGVPANKTVGKPLVGVEYAPDAVYQSIIYSSKGASATFSVSGLQFNDYNVRLHFFSANPWFAVKNNEIVFGAKVNGDWAFTNFSPMQGVATVKEHLAEDVRGTVNIEIVAAASNKEFYISGIELVPIGNANESVDVTFDLNGAPGVEPALQTVTVGEKATEPTEPVWGDKIFVGWYTDAVAGTLWDFDLDEVYGDLTLFARWSNGAQETETILLISELLSNVTLVSDRVPVNEIYNGVKFTSSWHKSGSSQVFPDVYWGHDIGKFIILEDNKLKSIGVDFYQTMNVKISSSNPLNADVIYNNCSGYMTLSLAWTEPSGEVSIDILTGDKTQFRLAEIVYCVALEMGEIPDYLPTPTVGFDASVMKITGFALGQQCSIATDVWVDVEQTDISLGYILLEENQLDVEYGIKVKAIASAQDILDGYVDSQIQSITISRLSKPTGLVGVPPHGAGNNGRIVGTSSDMEYKIEGSGAYLSCTGSEITGLAEGTYYVRNKAVGQSLASEPLLLSLQGILGDIITDLDRREPSGNIYATIPGSDDILPAIIRVSEGMKPGNAVSIYGEYFTRRSRVKLSDGINEWVIIPDQIDSAGQYIRFIWPDYIPAGVYVVKVSTNDSDGTWSVQEGYLNRPDGQWTNDLRAYTGMEINLFGRNLDASQFGGTENTKVRVIKVAQPDSDWGTLIQEISPSIVTPYRVAFTAPLIDNGENYIIQVNVNAGGIGSEWVAAMQYPDSVERLVIEGVDVPNFASYVNNPAATGIIQGMNVSWAGKFKWNDVYNVKSYGAVGNGTNNDTTAIQSALNAAKNAGGGVVYLPAGTYKITAAANRRVALSIGRGVVLQGEGKDANGDYLSVLDFDTETVITYGNDMAVIANDGGMGLQGVVGLKINFGANSALINLDNNNRMFGVFLGGGWGVYGINHRNVFVYDCHIDMGTFTRKQTAMSINASEVLIANNYLKSGLCTQQYQQMGEYVTFRDNTVIYADGNFGMEANNMAIMDNDIDVIFQVPPSYYSGADWSVYSKEYGYVSEDVHGIFVYGRCHYVSNNQISNIASVRGHYAGEGIALDSYRGVAASETIVDAGENWVSFAENYLVNSMRDFTGWDIMVNDGIGIGQVRTVVRSEYLGGPWKETKVYLDKPWDVLPVWGSTKISIGKPHMGNVFERNEIGPTSNSGVQFYYGCWDNVASENYLFKTLGIAIWGGNRGGESWRSQHGSTTFFSQIRDNEIYDFEQHFNHDAVLLEWGDEGEYYIKPWGTSLYANEWRNNSIDKTNNAPVYGPLDNPSTAPLPNKGSYGRGFGIWVFHHGVDADYDGLTGKRSVASLFEDCYVANSESTPLRLEPGGLHGLFIKNFSKDANSPGFIDDGGINTFVWQDDQKGILHNGWTASANSGSATVNNAIDTGSGASSAWTTGAVTGTVSLTIDTKVRDIVIGERYEWSFEENKFKLRGNQGRRIYETNPYRIIDKIMVDAVAVSGTFNLYAAAMNGASGQSAAVVWGSPVLTIENVTLADFDNGYLRLDELAVGRYFKLEFVGIKSAISLRNVDIFPFEESPKGYLAYGMGPIWNSETVPSKPLGFSAVFENQKITFGWQEPASKGRSAITGYEILVIGGRGQYAAPNGSVVAVGANARTHVITGLESDACYSVQIRALNSIGAGEYTTALFVGKMFTITAAQTLGGTIECDLEEATPGTEVVFAVSPNVEAMVEAGFPKAVTDEGVYLTVGNGADVGEYVFIMPEDNVTIECEFVEFVSPMPGDIVECGAVTAWLEILDAQGNIDVNSTIAHSIDGVVPDMNVINVGGLHLGMGVPGFLHSKLLITQDVPGGDLYLEHGANLVIELDETYLVSGFFFYQLWLSDKNLMFQTSLDGETWVNVYNNDTINFDWNNKFVFEPLPTYAKYVRVLVPGATVVAMPYGVKISGAALTEVRGVQIEPTNSEVQRESIKAFAAVVDAIGGAETDVIWSVSGSQIVPGRNYPTEINEYGVLFVSPYETSSTLIVTATSVFDSNVSDSGTVTVLDSLTLKNITITQSEGGSVSTSVLGAWLDEVVTITVTPEAGMVLAGLTIVRGERNSVYSVDQTGENEFSFGMPDENVTIDCVFVEIGHEFTVNFVTNGGGYAPSVKVAVGNTIPKPTHLSGKPGFRLSGWYMDSTLNKKWYFENVISQDMTLYAKWVVDEVKSFIPSPLLNLSQAQVSNVQGDIDAPNGRNLGYEIKMKMNAEVLSVGYPAYPITTNHTIYIIDITDLSITDYKRYEYSWPNPMFKLNDSFILGRTVAKVTVSPGSPQKEGYYYAELDEPAVLWNDHTYSIFSTEITDNAYLFMGVGGLYDSMAATLISDRMNWHADGLPTFYNVWAYMDCPQIEMMDGIAVGQNFWFEELFEHPCSFAKNSDLNNNGQTDVNDLSILLDNYGKLETEIDDLRADVIGDGLVDSADLSWLLENYGKYNSHAFYPDI